MIVVRIEIRRCDQRYREFVCNMLRKQEIQHKPVVYLSQSASIPTWEVVCERLKQRTTCDQLFRDRRELVLCGQWHVDDHSRRNRANRVQNLIQFLRVRVNQRCERLRTRQSQRDTLTLSLRLLKKVVIMGTPCFLMICGISCSMIDTACSFVSTDSHHITSQLSLSWIMGKNAPVMRAGSIESITDADRRTLCRRLVASLTYGEKKKREGVH